jgi:hypothetical protein
VDKLAKPNKILNLQMEDTEVEIELGDGGKWHTQTKVAGACVQILRGHEISSGREYAKRLHIIPDIVDRWMIVIPREGGKKVRTRVEAWHEYIDNCDQHIEKHPVVKRWIASGGLKDIYKIHKKDFPPTMTQEELWKELEYRLPE